MERQRIAAYITPTKYVKVTKADADLPDGPCRALYIGTAGTLNFMEVDGTIRTDFPAKEGYLVGAFRQVRTGGDADDIWAVY